MRTSADGIDFIRNEEGCRLEAYPDVVGIWTIGVGHVSKDVVKGLHITSAQADSLLRLDLARFEAAVDRAVNFPQLSQGQFDALVSLCFNVGAQAFADSTLVRLLNQGDAHAAGAQFARWCKAGGVYNEGLAMRRARELWVFARSSS